MPKTHRLQFEPSQTIEYLKLLAGEFASFTFQTFDDNKDRAAENFEIWKAARAANPNADWKDLPRRDPFAATKYGRFKRLEQFLQEKNVAGAGVYISVNPIEPYKARKIEFCQGVRAVWQEADKPYTGGFPLEQSFTVRSSRAEGYNKLHNYWICSGLTPADHKAVMRRMVQKYGSDENAMDLVRVLRLPGFYHMKNPAKPQLVELVYQSGMYYRREHIIDAFKPIYDEPAAPKAHAHGVITITDRRLHQALACIPADRRPVWIWVGQALKYDFGEQGRSLWDSWSQQADNYDDASQEKAWRSFKRTSGDCVTTDSIFKRARQDYGFRG